jgi:hypothetical protein
VLKLPGGRVHPQPRLSGVHLQEQTTSFCWLLRDDTAHLSCHSAHVAIILAHFYSSKCGYVATCKHLQQWPENSTHCSCTLTCSARPTTRPRRLLLLLARQNSSQAVQSDTSLRKRRTARSNMKLMRRTIA